MPPAVDSTALAPRGENAAVSAALSARRVQRRLNAEVLCRTAALPLWVAAAVYAALRLAVGKGSPVVALCLAALGLSAVVLRFRREAWTEPQAAVVLDRAAGAGGLLLTARERSSGAWLNTVEDLLRKAPLPAPKVGRPLTASLAALCFALVAGLLPEARPALPRIQEAAAARVAELAVKSEILAEEKIVADNLSGEVARLREEVATGRFDAAGWEAADATEQALDHAASERARELAAAEAAAGALASAISAQSGQEAEARAREELEQALLELSETGAGGKEAASAGAKPSASGDQENGTPGSSQEGTPGKEGQPRAAAAKSARSAADANALRRALAARREALEKRFPSRGSGNDGKGAGAECKGMAEGTTGMSPVATEPGAGGPGPGGGTAPLIYGTEVPMQVDRLGLHALPRADQPEPGELLGIFSATPEVKDGAASVPGSAAGAGADGVAPASAPVAPRHHELLKRYFESRKGRAP